MFVLKWQATRRAPECAKTVKSTELSKYLELLFWKDGGEGGSAGCGTASGVGCVVGAAAGGRVVTMPSG